MYSLYWIKALHHQDPFTEGYIGCSNQPKIRFKSHTTDNTTAGSKLVKKYVQENGLDSVTMEILAEFPTEMEAKTLERLYRPKVNIGWNIQVGGLKNPICKGRIDKESSKRKRVKSMLATRSTRIYVSPFKGKTDRWSEEQKAKIGSYHKGKTITQEHIKSMLPKISGANSGCAKAIAIKNLETDVITVLSFMRQIEQTNLPITYSALRSAKRVYLMNKSLRIINKKYVIVPEQGQD